MPDSDISTPVARSIESTCDHYGWTRTFVYERLRTGELAAIKAGRRTLVTSESANRLFARLPKASFSHARKVAA